MNDKRPSDMPNHWDPSASDDDAQWEAISQLMREADQPKVPSNRQFTELYARVKIGADLNQPSEISKASARQSSDENFGSWLKSLFLGGGGYAQLVRVGAVAAATAFVLHSGSSQESPQTTPVTDMSNPQMLAMLKNIAYYQNDQHQSLIGINDRVTYLSTQIPDQSDNIVAISNASNTDWREVKNSLNWENTMQVNSQPISVSNGFGYSDQPSYQLTPQTPIAKQKLLNSLQKLRFETILDNRSPQDVEYLNQMERAMAPLLQDDASFDDTEVYANELFQKGEKKLVDGHHDDALRIYDEIRRMVPGSFLAFMSQFRIAEVEFNTLQDYDAALKDYRKALEQYPSHFLSNKHKDVITTRIDLLMKNYDSEWRAMKLWHQAQQSSEGERVAHLKNLLSRYPDYPLSAQAAEELLKVLTTDPTDEWVTPEELLMLTRLALSTPMQSHAAQLQFVQSEILFRRMMSFDQARQSYREVAGMHNSEPYTDLVNRRLAQLNRVLEED